MTVPLESRTAQLEARLIAAQSNLRRLHTASQGSLGLGQALLLVILSAMLTAAAPSLSRATAPFRVVDAAGKPIFEVDAAPPEDPSNPYHSWRLYDSAGEVVVAAAAPGKSSFFKIESADRNTVTVLGQQDADLPLLALRSGGAFKNRVVVAVEDQKPSLGMANAAGNIIVNLEQGEHGGALQLAGPEGYEVVGMGVHEPGVGIVRAQPVGNAGVNVPRTPLFKGLGMSGTFICGLGCKTP